MSNRVAHVASALFLVAAIALAPAAFASKGGKPGGGGETSSSLTLVLLNSSDGLPHYGQQVTFNVSTTATDRPLVQLAYFQGELRSTPIRRASIRTIGGHRSSPLSSNAWTGEAAECTANLVYTRDGTRLTTVATFISTCTRSNSRT